MDEEPQGKITTLTSDIRLNDKNKWEVVLVFKQQRSFDLIKWEERTASVRMIDKDESRALTEANMVLAAQLTKANYDLFNLEEKELLHD
jgi:hypothetical protein